MTPKPGAAGRRGVGGEEPSTAGAAKKVGGSETAIALLKGSSVRKLHPRFLERKVRPKRLTVRGSRENVSGVGYFGGDLKSTT